MIKYAFTSPPPTLEVRGKKTYVSLRNVDRDISVIGYWIFDSNYEKLLVLNIESLDMICAPSVGEEQVYVFETVFTVVRYICPYAYLKTE